MGNTTNTDPRSQRIRARRMGGQIPCSNSQFICIRRPARSCVLPVPRGPDRQTYLTSRPSKRGTTNNMQDDGFIESFDGRLRTNCSTRLCSPRWTWHEWQPPSGAPTTTRPGHTPRSPGRRRTSSPEPSTRDGRSHCATPKAPRKRPPLHPPSRA